MTQKQEGRGAERYASWSVKSQTSEIVKELLEFGLVQKKMSSGKTIYVNTSCDAISSPVIRKAFGSISLIPINSNRLWLSEQGRPLQVWPARTCFPCRLQPSAYSIQGVSLALGQAWLQLNGYSACGGSFVTHRCWASTAPCWQPVEQQQAFVIINSDSCYSVSFLCGSSLVEVTCCCCFFWSLFFKHLAVLHCQ